ncbi:MAG: DUF4907 domain-containing protein [Bacteroidota bacterium]
MKNIIYLVLLISLSFCQNPQSEETTSVESLEDSLEKSLEQGKEASEKARKILEENTEASESSFRINTFQDENGWGYDIIREGKILIHQPHRPGLPGREGFDSEEKARKTAELVRHKLENNIMPPSVTTAELDSIGVLN